MRLRRSLFAVASVTAALVLASCGGDDEDDTTTESNGDEAEENGDEAEENGDEAEENGDEGGGDGDSITIGIKFDQPGLGLREGDDYTGFDVDVATYVAGELGYSEDQIEWLEAPTPERENLLENGTVDMVVATYSITDERAERVDFVGPYFIAGQGLLVPEDNTDINGPDDLDGKLLCSVTGSTPAQRIQEEYSEGAQLQEYDTYSNCIEALGTGVIDAVTTDDIILAGYAAQSENVGNMKLVGEAFSEENYGIGLPMESGMCEDVAAAVTQMIDDGSWEQFVADNVGETGYEPNAALNPPTPEAC